MADYNLDESIGYWANKAARALTNELNKRFAAAGLGITVEQWRVLLLLREGDGLTQNEIAEHLLQEKTGVSRLIDGLERRGLVERICDAQDRRNKRIYMSVLGVELQDVFLKEARATLEKAQKDIRAEDLTVCRGVLRHIFRNLIG